MHHCNRLSSNYNWIKIKRSELKFHKTEPPKIKARKFQIYKPKCEPQNLKPAIKTTEIKTAFCAIADQAFRAHVMWMKQFAHTHAVARGTCWKWMKSLPGTDSACNEGSKSLGVKTKKSIKHCFTKQTIWDSSHIVFESCQKSIFF